MNEVEIVVKSSDRTNFNAIGNRMRSTMASSARDSVKDVDKEFTRGFKDVGDHSGKEFGDALDEHLRVWSQHATEQVDVKVKTKFKEVGEHSGSSFAEGLERSIKGGGRDLGGNLGGTISDNFSKSFAGGLREVGAYGMAVLAGVLVAEAPAIGAVAALGIVAAFGAGLAGLGLAAAFGLKPVQREFSQFKKFLGSFMKDIGQPFVSTWSTIFNVAGNVLKQFQPILKGTFKDFIAPAVTSFVLRLGEAFTKLAPAIRPVGKAFSELLGSVGKSLPGIFDGISKSIISMANTISANPDLFAGFITGMFKIVEGGTKVIAFLARLFGAFANFLHTKNPFAVMAASLSPVLAILMHLGKAGDVFNALGKAASTLGQHLGPLFDKIGKQAGPELSKIGDQIKNELVPAFTDFLSAAAPVAGKLIDLFGPKVVSGISNVLHLVSGLVDIISGGLNVAAGLLSGNWGKVWDGIVQQGRGALKALKSIGKELLDSLTLGHGDQVIKIAVKAVDQASGVLHSVENAAKKIAGSKVVRVLVNGAGAAVSAVSSVIKTINRFVGKTVHIGQSGASAAASAVSNVIHTINRFVGKTVHIGESGAAAAVSAVNSLINTIRRLVGKVVHVGANVTGLGAVRGLIGAIAGVASKTVNIIAHRIGFAHGGVVGHAAEGGPRSNTVMVGEHGPELVDLPAGSRVRSNSDTRAALAGGGGSDQPILVQLVLDGKVLASQLITPLRGEIRTRGGRANNSVQRILGGTI